MVEKSNARVKYENRTKALIESFKARRISFEKCISDLDAAFESFLVSNEDELSAVRALVLDNNNAVMQEMARRPIHVTPRKKSTALAAKQFQGTTQAYVRPELVINQNPPALAGSEGEFHAPPEMLT